MGPAQAAQKPFATVLQRAALALEKSGYGAQDEIARAARDVANVRSPKLTDVLLTLMSHMDDTPSFHSSTPSKVDIAVRGAQTDPRLLPVATELVATTLTSLSKAGERDLRSVVFNAQHIVRYASAVDEATHKTTALTLGQASLAVVSKNADPYAIDAALDNALAFSQVVPELVPNIEVAIESKLGRLAPTGLVTPESTPIAQQDMTTAQLLLKHDSNFSPALRGALYKTTAQMASFELEHATMAPVDNTNNNTQRRIVDAYGIALTTGLQSQKLQPNIGAQQIKLCRQTLDAAISEGDLRKANSLMDMTLSTCADGTRQSWVYDSAFRLDALGMKSCRAEQSDNTSSFHDIINRNLKIAARHEAKTVTYEIDGQHISAADHAAQTVLEANRLWMDQGARYTNIPTNAVTVLQLTQNPVVQEQATALLKDYCDVGKTEMSREQQRDMAIQLAQAPSQRFASIATLRSLAEEAVYTISDHPRDRKKHVAFAKDCLFDVVQLAERGSPDYVAARNGLEFLAAPDRVENPFTANLSPETFVKRYTAPPAPKTMPKVA